MDLDDDDYNSGHVSGIVPFHSANNTLEGTTFYTCQNCSVSTDCGCSKINEREKIYDTPCSTTNIRYILHLYILLNKFQASFELWFINILKNTILSKAISSYFPYNKKNKKIVLVNQIIF